VDQDGFDIRSRPRCAPAKPTSHAAIVGLVAQTPQTLIADDQVLVDITRDRQPDFCRTDLHREDSMSRLEGSTCLAGASKRQERT
jgi:hypothetical protein